jgi:hypothetical protein
LEEKSPLNISDGFGEVIEPVADPCKLAESLLTAVVELFFCYVRPDGTEIDLEKLESAKEFKKYKSSSAALKKVSW